MVTYGGGAGRCADRRLLCLFSGLLAQGLRDGGLALHIPCQNTAALCGSRLEEPTGGKPSDRFGRALLVLVGVAAAKPIQMLDQKSGRFTDADRRPTTRWAS